MGVSLLAWAYWPISERAVLDDYMEIWTELKALRSQAASADEWAEFEKRSKSRLEPTLRRLERVARSDRPAKQELLWAGRFCLWKMLGSQGRHSNDLESNFVQHLERVKRIWDGTDGDDEPLLQASLPANEDAEPVRSVGGLRRLGSTIPPGAAGYQPPAARWRSGR